MVPQFELFSVFLGKIENTKKNQFDINRPLGVFIKDLTPLWFFVGVAVIKD